MCYCLWVMLIIPSHKIRALFRSEFDNLQLSTEHRLQVDVAGEVYRLQSVQENYIKMAKAQKANHPELATQRKLEELLQFKVLKRIETDLRGQLVLIA